MPETRYDDLRALYVNCTLKRSPEPSNTEGLVNVSRRILEKHGVEVESVGEADGADVLVIAGPIWLGDNSSVTK